VGGGRRARRRSTLALALGIALLAAAGCGGTAGSRPGSGAAASPAARALVRVAAAADLRSAMDDLVAAFATARPGIDVRVAYGSSGTFAAQIANGAPFDVFFSADASYPRRLEAAGLAAPGATRLYAIGRLVVWVPLDSPLDVEGGGLALLADEAVRTVAIANPEHAPYGRAAVAALAAAGVLAAVEPKLVLGENVSQAAQFVETGGADAGVIALSLALAPPLAGRGRHVLVPVDSYPPLEQGAVVLAAARDPDAAAAFLAFAVGGDGQRVLARYGFEGPDR
jgi:molybdate transport system substrate-binding protein